MSYDTVNPANGQVEHTQHTLDAAGVVTHSTVARARVAADVAALERLGITEVAAVIGGSMGGARALEWIVTHPDSVRAALVLAVAWRDPGTLRGLRHAVFDQAQRWSPRVYEPAPVLAQVSMSDIVITEKRRSSRAKWERASSETSSTPSSSAWADLTFCPIRN